MNIMNTFPSWNTTKVSNGFKATVIKLESLDEKNENGVYCNETVMQTGVFSSRAKAKTWAQKWVRYYRANGF